MNTLREFRLVVVDVWQKGLYGIDIGRIVTAVLIFLGFLLVRRLFTRVVIHRLKAISRRTKTRLDDEALEVLEKPVSFIPVVVGVFFATDYLPLSGALAGIADRIVRSLVVLVIFWGIVNLLRPLSEVFRQLEDLLTTALVDWLIKATRIAFIFVGAATVLEIWGIQIAPILAGLGLLGVAVALGAQDLFKNLIAGLLVIAEKRFTKGDWIKVDGVAEGIVETIGFRSTLIRRFDKAPVHVPNSKLSDNSLTNFSAMTHRRIFWIIGVEYRTTIPQLREIRDSIESFIVESDDFAKPPEVPMFVRVDRFSDSSIDIMVYCFTKTTQWGVWLEIKERLAYRIKEIVEEAGTSFAFPSRSIYIEPMDSGPAEVFVPPGTTGSQEPVQR